MNHVKIKGKTFPLNGDLITKNTQLNFKAIDRANKEVQLKDVKGMKVISSFPDINTIICDRQTITIGQMAKQYPDVNFISISTNDVETINKWCALQKLDNITIWSDQKYQDFGKKTHTLIGDLNILARGFIIVDPSNKIVDLAFHEEVAHNPDFSLLEKYLKK